MTADAPTLTRAVVVEGLSATLWFSWGPADPPRWLVTATTVGAMLAIIAFVAGLVIGRSVRDQHAAVRQQSVQQRYRQVVVTEFAVLIVAGMVLGMTVGVGWAAVWVCGAVGVHFVPLARVLPGLGLPALGAGITTIAIAALVVGLATDVAPTAVTGPGTGLLLLLAAAWSLMTLFWARTSRAAVRRNN